MSGSIGAQFVTVDNSAALTGFNTFDLEVISNYDWGTSALVLELTQGSIFQDVTGGNTAPNAGSFGAFPTLEFDTYVTSPTGTPWVVVGATQVPVLFDATGLNVDWFNTIANETGTYDLARITLSDDAVGTWSLIISTGAGKSLTDSGLITAGTFDMVPTPAPPPPIPFDVRLTPVDNSSVFTGYKTL